MRQKFSPSERGEVRMIWIATGLFLLIVLVSAALADEPKLPTGFTCDDVRAKVAELGRLKALALAIENGATWAQIREAKKCLK